MLLDDIAAYLQTNSLGTVGTDIFKGSLPDQPDNCIALFEYAGDRPEHAQGAPLDKPGLQIRVRNKSYSSARQKCQEIQNLLHGIHEQIINNTRYVLMLANQSPEPLGRDASDRMEFVQNYSVTYERS